MILKADRIAHEIEVSANSKDPFVITPKPDVEKMKASGSSSLDLRLGCWFLTLRDTRVPRLDVYDEHIDIPNEHRLTKSHFVPLGTPFILHPQTFVLGVTLEWMRFPGRLAGYVVGRSSWGRHGLVIATATGVHPGFTGCLTLELKNVGAIPITVKPGTMICQLFIHRVDTSDQETKDQSHFIGQRRPTLGAIELDETARKLAESTGL